MADFTDAIAVFREIDERHKRWYMGHERVSLAMMSERGYIEAQCKWAIERLEAAAKQTHVAGVLASDSRTSGGSDADTPEKPV